MNRATANLVDAGKWLASGHGSGLSALFFAMARARHAPAVHPRGVTFSARLTVSVRTPLIAQGNYLATVRLSKGAGTPKRWPDVLGLALRFHSFDTAEPCDFLFSSAGDGQWTRWLPVPAGDWSAASYGTLAPYESAGLWWWLMLRPSGPPVGHASIQELEHAAPPGFALHISGESADSHQVGELSLHKHLAETGLVFDPALNHPATAVAAPNWLRELRERAYTGSRRGRDAPSPPGSETPPRTYTPTLGPNGPSNPRRPEMSPTNPTTRSMTATPVQTGATVVAVAFLAVGVLGFIPGITTDYDTMMFGGHHSEAKLLGLFQVSILHNIVHLLFGIVGLALARTAKGARNYLIGGGAVYLVLWVYGLVIDQTSTANFVPLNTADNWLHLILGVAMIGLGIVLSRGLARTTTRAPSA